LITTRKKIAKMPNSTHEKASITLIWLQYAYAEMVLVSFFVGSRVSPHEAQSELLPMKSLLSTVQAPNASHTMVKTNKRTTSIRGDTVYVKDKHIMSKTSVAAETAREYIVYSLYKCGKNMLAKYPERPRTVPASNA